MGAMLRSENMTFCDIYLQPEAAFEILSQLGEISCVEFTDMNAEVQAFQRNFISEVCRCAEMERKLRYMESEMRKDKIYTPDLATEPKAMQPNEVTLYENILEKWVSDIQEMSDNQTGLLKTYLELNEMHYVLDHIGPILGDAELRSESIFSSLLQISSQEFQEVLCGSSKVHEATKSSLCSKNYPFYIFTRKDEKKFIVVMRGLPTYAEDQIAEELAFMGFNEVIVLKMRTTASVVKRRKSYHFEMMLWRISRGNIYYRQAKEDRILKDPYTGKEIRKVAFLAVCQGEELGARMEKIFSGFRVNTYSCPRTLEERIEMINRLDLRISDLQQVVKRTQYHRCKALRSVGRQWHMWMVQVKKAKAIYHTMNLFNLDVTKKCLLGQCWVPDRDLKKVQEILEYCSEVIGTNVPSFLSKSTTLLVSPTYHRTNKFTRAFQALISAYGDSVYKELNPALYSIITFPFLFAVMFGDTGHGTILITFGLWMVLKEKQYMEKTSSSEIWNIFFGGRYVILLMGIFSVYTGIIYNDLFGKGLCWMNSYWRNTFNEEQLAISEFHDLDPRIHTRQPYIVGMDPALMMATNSMMVENSIKMKLSIIFGVIHMLFGISLSLVNHIYYKKYHAIFLQFIPQLLFMSCIYLWLVILIYYKWFKYNSKSGVKISPNCAPHVLMLFIDMILLKTSKPPGEECDAYMFPSQKMVQHILVLVAVLCVPVLLFGTPIYNYHYNKRMRKSLLRKRSPFRRYQYTTSDMHTEEQLTVELVAYNKPFSDLMMDQTIHTIEFVLNSISHTASYLRLWALSLAHAQLSEMLWEMVLSKLALRDHTLLGCVKIFVIFAIWAVFTISILVVMEGLSAFLHTLRLHWMEFMSKFYSGTGYRFRPFSLKVLSEADEKTESPTKETTNRSEKT